MTQQLLKGNIAMAEAAVRAGCQAYFGYPITPQTELLEHLAERMPALGRVFLQAESEVAAINMVYGAAAAGARVMTSTSGPGFSLMEEGLSYIAGSDLPVVIINVMRGGPGLGNIQPSQGDYFQITKSMGHGDFHPIVLAPMTIQEAIDLTVLAFDLAEEYRTIAIVAADGTIGQMMEPAELPLARPTPAGWPAWALTGAQGRERRIVNSLFMGADSLEEQNKHLQAKLAAITAAEIRYATYAVEDAELIIVAFGTAARVAQTAVQRLRADGLRVGLFRPITLWPFPEQALGDLALPGRQLLVVEMNAGQMLLDVRAATRQSVPVAFFGRMGGQVPLPEEITAQALRLLDAVPVAAGCAA